MSKGSTHDDFDFGNDPEFQKNFYKNIDKVLSEDFFEPMGEEEEIIASDIADLLDDADDTVDVEHTDAAEDVEAAEDTEVYENTDLAEDTEGLEAENAEEAEDEVADEAEDVEEADETESSEEADETQEVEETDETEEADETQDADDTEDADATESDMEPDDELDEADIALALEEETAGLEQLDETEVIDETLIDINNSLAQQIGEELENLEADTLKDKKKSRLMKIMMGVLIGLVSLVAIASFFGFTKPGNKLLLKMGITLGGKLLDTWTQDFTDEPDVIEDEDYLDAEDLASEAEEIDPSTIVWPEHPGFGRKEEGVYNILLLGEEAIDSGNSRGRTDLIIIATLNKNNKAIKLTSLMRDTLVQIPGYKENKLNTAYEKGNVDLLYETISLNFNIHLDGCVLVNFENFEDIIDYMGGLEITLTAAEAKYLRNTNYISNPKYRTVVEGKNLMNGNQVLGYSRVRKRAAITGNNNDYGRTDRHRIILNAIFEKYKSKSKVELLTAMMKILPMVKTDIDSKTFEKLLMTFLEMGTTKIEQLRIPADGMFTDNVKVRGMDVLIPDLPKNVSLLHGFIFGSSNN